MPTMQLLLLALAALAGTALGDTPANCTVDDILGTWLFYETERGHNGALACDESLLPSALKHRSRYVLEFPDIASDALGNVGTWTIVYNQGSNSTSTTAASSPSPTGPPSSGITVQVQSLCSQTKAGWSHDVYVRDWSCFVGRNVGQHATKTHRRNNQPLLGSFRANPALARKINRRQDSWTAGVYEDFEGLSLRDYVRKMGGEASRIQGRPSARPATMVEKREAAYLPRSFDWRDVGGRNFVSPVRNQGSCGSCYSFSSAGMLEARYRILSNNTQSPVFAPQDVVQCSPYSQGCAGGFPYLIAGKYAEDFGLVLEESNPYALPEPKEGVCKTPKSARRYYATNYRYVGGYYGGCNEPLMRKALVENGPLAVGFEVYDDFSSYKGGVYHHTGLRDHNNRFGRWDPFELTNHAVLVVGYGTDEKSGDDYWTVKNSWGEGWGESGYFRIRRGTDECGIESLAMESTPIVTF